MTRPVIGITIGDPSGVGPEISLKALKNEEVLSSCIPVLYGDEAVLRRAAPIVGCTKEIVPIGGPEEAKEGRISVVSPGVLTGPYEFAKVQGQCGRAAFAYIERAISDAMAGKIAAVVTGPLNKEALHAGGINYSGHTEIFADLTGTKDYAMLLMGGGVRVIHVSTHVALREACDRATKERVLTVIRLADKAVKALGVPEPRIAVAGLNPHSGESGLFGHEEIEEIIPAIEAARGEGMNVTGPVPPDTVFVKTLRGESDIVVAMYHDQGHIPLKITDFMGGVNVTVGLPIIRTSVDHGTAYGKAGKGTADESSMVSAVRAAVQFARNR
ncbi:MAG: 4-hydroxythreonine-4-phosphate dehydrogenase PdxA [Synergistaceae bacterium]|nr:4-hydroxythreonine-4-phosphate dehydrogenase PdxA [Synergistaceae bacterium]